MLTQIFYSLFIDIIFIIKLGITMQSNTLKMNKEKYKTSNAPTINHFHEKLLLLKSKMNTTTGKKMAAQRHEFMEIFLHQFYQEWEGEK